jgi:ppGpp synthetase/RelA/SpoT-type nucleotidyltranferase
MPIVVPASFRARYDEIEPLLKATEEFLKSRLPQEFADWDPVTIQTRPKGIESLYSKLQKGEMESIWDLDDLVGARAVFLHPSQVKAALHAARTAFDPVEEKNIEARNPTDFRYQQPHLIVRLPREFTDRNPQLANLKIELQFTTYIQHALQESTHDVIYKGGKFSWREHRMDSRLRGLLEIVDDVLVDISNIAAVEEEPAYPLFDNRNEILEVVKRVWGEAELPDDMRRFVITIEGLLKGSKISNLEFEQACLNTPDLINALSISPLDKVVGVLLRWDAQKVISGLGKRRILVTRELEDLVPEVRRVPQGKRVTL